MHQIIRAVRFHLEFFQDHALFLLDIVGTEERVEHQVRFTWSDHSVAFWDNLAVQHFGIEADQFFGSKGVEIAADGVHRARDILGRPLRRALEKHVLDEVGDAVLLDIFAARAGADPNAHRHGANVGHSLGNHTHAVRERGHFDVPQGTGL